MAHLVGWTLASWLAITSLVHVTVYLLSATLPLHMIALGGSTTQVGLLFAVSAGFSMLLRPLVGGWVDRHGFRAVMLPGAAPGLAWFLLVEWRAIRRSVLPRPAAGV